MIKVCKMIKPGMFSTVQDLGRIGYQKDGIIVSGAMDTYSFQLANLLVGNDRNDPALEITVIGPVIEFLVDTQIAITGAETTVLLDDEKIHLWKSYRVKKGQILKFLPATNGVRLYLAIAGGIVVPKVLNSAATYVAGKLGGFQGRKLEKGDILLGKVDPYIPKYERFLCKKYIPNIRDKSIIRVIKGPEFTQFTDESVQHFFQSYYEITETADRMGYRLFGKQLTRKVKRNMISDAVTFGTIQVPEDGQPIILMADRQTTGGYDRIANVISVDLPKLAQLAPRSQIRFQEVSLQKAQKLFLQQEKLIRSIEIGARIL